MKYIQIGFHFDDDLGLRKIQFQHNETELKNDSELIKNLAITMLRSVNLNKNDCLLQDLLNDLDINLNDSG